MPFYGWYWRRHGFIYVRKSWQDDGPRLLADLGSLPTYHSPYWLVLYPEGTRFTPARAAKCHEFAAQRGLALLNNVLTPRTKVRLCGF